MDKPAGRAVADKRVTAQQAAALVRDGDHVAIGGTLYSRTPMALVFALLRARRRHLTVSRSLACYEIELFLSTGALDRVVTSWVGIGLPWGLAPIFRHYVERGEASYDEWSHLAMGLRYKAGAMGVPFLPTLTMLGSDLAATLDLQTVSCPYTGQQLAAVPALNPDVALIHAHRADMFGNVQVDGYRHMDVDIARAARTVIVSAEQIVTSERDRRPGRPDDAAALHRRRRGGGAVRGLPERVLWPVRARPRALRRLRGLDKGARSGRGPALRSAERRRARRLRRLPRRGRARQAGRA